MKTYTLKLSSGTVYKLYDGTTLVADTDLGTLFGTSGSAYFVFDFNSGTPSDLTAISITNSSDTEVMGITGLAAGTVKEDYNFKGEWDGVSTIFTSFAQLSGQALDEAELSFLMGKIKSAGPGKIKELTSADYDYPDANPTGVALWRLEAGVYKITGNTKAYCYQWFNTPTSVSNYSIVIVAPSTNANTRIVEISSDLSYSPRTCKTSSVSGQRIEELNFFHPIVNDTLTSTSTRIPLTANQGRVLKYYIDSISQSGSGAPTTSTTGTVGQLYQDTTNGKLYQCTAVTPGTDPDPDTYTWEEVGGGGITPVQTTGTSTTDVMSQKATTDMVFSPTQADSIVISKTLVSNQREQVIIGEGTSSTQAGTGNGNIVIGSFAKGTSNGYNQSISIGKNAEVARSAYGIAIGYDSYVKDGTSGVAIGGGSYASQKGQFDISVSRGNPAGNGYNNSNYRLLTGLYDGQSAHDAATYGQLKNAIINGGTTAPTTTTVGVVGTQYTYVDTTGTPTAHLCVCTEIDTTDPDNPVYTWQTLV